MSKGFMALRNRIRAASAAQAGDAANKQLSLRVRGMVASVLEQTGAVNFSGGHGDLGLESLGDMVPTRNQNFDAATAGDPEGFMSQLQKLGMPARFHEQVTESCLMMLDGSYKHQDVLRGGFTPQGNVAEMAQVVGRTSAAGMSAMDNDMAMEAFGDDMNRLATDDRLSMSLVIMRPWENVMDKAFARVNESSPVVTIRVPLPEVYDWSATQKAGSTAQERNRSTPLRDLYRNPTRVNSAPKRIVAVGDNDTAGVLWNKNVDVNYYKTGVQISTLDLSRTTNTFGFGQVDRTDIVADGGLVDSLLVTVTDPANSNRKEVFKLNTRAFAMALFTTAPMNKTSGDRIVNMPVTLPIMVGTKQYDDSTSQLAAALTDATMLVKLQVNAHLNLETGILHITGSANKELVQKDAATPISSATQTKFGQLLVEFSAASVETYFDEQNQRKANMAVWCQYREMQFVVPRSRVYFTEYSLTQDVDENAISATSTVIALGNGRRGLDVVVNRLNDVANTLAFIDSAPAIAKVNQVDEQSFVSSLVKPTVITTEMNFDVEELNVMNESTRLSEVHGRFRARMLTMATQLMANSLMLNQYKGGETPVIKVLTHNTIADILIGIVDYHPDLDDRAAVATGADYSMKLPNGYRLDVIKTNLDCMKGRLYAVPVMESDMSSLLSAASIRDCGTVTTNYAPTNGGSVVRRVATTTREIVMMSNPVGIMMNIYGLDKQFGESKYQALPLNDDNNDKIAV